MRRLFLAALLMLAPCMALAETAGGARNANPVLCDDLRAQIAVDASQDNTARRNAALYQAAGKGCVTLAEDLLNQGASVLARDRNGDQALHHAAEGGDVATIGMLVAHGAPVDQGNAHGSTPLLLAVLADKPKAVTALLDAGAGAEAPGEHGVTPLTAAAFNGDDRIVAMLLDRAHANPAEADGTGKGAAEYAAARGFLSTLKLLLDAGLDPNATYAHGLTALMWAAGHGNDVPEQDGLATVQFLVARGATLAPVDDRGRSALMIAAERGHAAIVSYLRAQGADATLHDRTGKTALDLAANDAVRKALHP